METSIEPVARRLRVVRLNTSIRACKALEIVLEHWLAAPPIVVPVIVSFEELESSIEILREEIVQSNEGVKSALRESDKLVIENSVRKRLIRNSIFLDLSYYERMSSSDESEITVIQSVSTAITYIVVLNL